MTNQVVATANKMIDDIEQASSTAISALPKEAATLAKLFQQFQLSVLRNNVTMFELLQTSFAPKPPKK